MIRSENIRGLFPLLAAAVLVVSIVSLDVAINGTSGLTREGGGIETATALLYIFAAITYLRARGIGPAMQNWEIPAVLLMMAGREFDLDKRLTSIGLLKSRLYLTTEAPLYERIFGFAAVAFAAVVLFRLASRHVPDLIRAFRRRAPYALAVLAGAVITVTSKSIDGLNRKLEPFGVTFSEQQVAMLGVVEECMELFIPLFFILAISLAARTRRGSVD